ncbi:MAG: site-specific integrase [Erysipelotrichaceae bacterium]|nr:site-specific integrase [Erysipelotrichaceae bacterium]
MTIYKDEKSGSWVAQVKFKDMYGVSQRKTKRFKTRREAKEWAVDFLAHHTKDINTTLDIFFDMYTHDLEKRIRYNTMNTKKTIYTNYIQPILGSKKLSEISMTDILQWQNYVISLGKANTYVHTISNQLTAIFNHAEKYYGLTNNPLRRIDKIGSKAPENIDFWTYDEFKQFISVVDDESSFIQFNVLFYTGIRVGELIALQLKDINLSKGYLDINKSAQYENSEYIFTDTKTPKSKRKVTIPRFLCDLISNYIKKFYFIEQNEQVFMTNKSRLGRELKKYALIAGVKPIRTHDLRHSHASFLIEQGVQPKLIQERLGHEKIETTLKVYSHLYPNKQFKLAEYIDQFVGYTNYDNAIDMSDNSIQIEVIH